MNNNVPGKKSGGFLAGKGFYIVLFLCAAVIGASAWMVASESSAVKKSENIGIISDNNKIQTVVITPQVDSVFNENVTEEAPEISNEEPNQLPEEAVSVSVQEGTVSLDYYVWPVIGEIERGHCVTALAYDVTMRDWRTHDGVDISAALGASVCAAHAGTVESIVNDDLYGTTVTILNSDGIRCIYANLAELPTVNVGEWVEPGTVIGSVGTTALCEIGQGTHLHFAMELNGSNIDPMSYLPC